jgi:citrate lyase subunit beta / citryl-CoA lyase
MDERTDHQAHAGARSFLFVPGDRPDLLAKAENYGPDAIVADLEDAVAERSKAEALLNVISWLRRRMAEPRGAAAWVRINTGERGIDDMTQLAEADADFGVYVPKAEGRSTLQALQATSPRADVALAPMIESATGLVNLIEIATTPGVVQLHLGELDLATDLGILPDDDGTELATARAQVVIASRHAQLLAPVAPVNARFDDPELSRRTTTALARMGFIGRDCIHPNQVAIANEAFTPDPTDVEWARRSLDDAAGRPGSYRGPDGTMIDEAVLRRARVTIARAAATSRPIR